MGEAKRKRLNALDALIIFAVIAAAAATFFYFQKGAGKTQGGLYFEVELRHCPPDFAEKIVYWTEARESVRGEFLGFIEHVKSEPEKYIAYDYETNSFVESYSDLETTVIIGIGAKSSQTESDIYAGKVPIKVGKELSVKGKGFAGTGYVVKMQQREE